MRDRLPCRHCNKRHSNRPRQLCWACYYAPGVRELYPSTSKFARRGVGNHNRCRAPGPPTDFAPRTREKVLLMAERVAQGMPAFSPGDAGWWGLGTREGGADAQ